MTVRPQAEPVDMAAEVARFLRANPSWLAENPALYAMLAPPVRVHGDIFADHMAAMLRAARARAATLAGQATDVVEAARAASGMTDRVHAAVLALMQAGAGQADGTHADLGDCISLELPGLLGIDAVTLCREPAPAAEPDRILRGERPLPAGTVARLLGVRDVLFRQEPDEGLILLHGEAARLARHDALVRVPLHGRMALLALASRDSQALHAGQGASAPAFLGRAVAAAMER